MIAIKLVGEIGQKKNYSIILSFLKALTASLKPKPFASAFIEEAIRFAFVGSVFAWLIQLVK